MGKLPNQDGEEPSDIRREETGDDGGETPPFVPDYETDESPRLPQPEESAPILIPKEQPPPPDDSPPPPPTNGETPKGEEPPPPPPPDTEEPPNKEEPPPPPPSTEEPPSKEEPPPTTTIPPREEAPKEEPPPPPPPDTEEPPKEDAPPPPPPDTEEPPPPPPPDTEEPPGDEEPPTGEEPPREDESPPPPPDTDRPPPPDEEPAPEVGAPPPPPGEQPPAPPAQPAPPAPAQPPPSAPLSGERMLQLLPGIYQENDFVRDFLRAFEKILLGRADGPDIGRGLEETIAGLADYFDPQKAPKEFLPWLADWTALSLRADLSDQQQRDFLANVIQLYRYRGTRENLRRLLAIFTGGLPKVTEYPNRPHYFYAVVSLPPDVQGKPAVIARLKEIAYALTDLEKPAHTDYDLDFDFPSMQVGVHSTVGVDTILGTPR
ncbi:MAG TPA: phage tail protein [Pyrinomonadaceae bacterium]|jgi:phage tail-like protein